MPITQLESNVVSRAIALARKVVTEVKPELDRLDVDINGAVGVGASLTQGDLDGVPSFSGLTTAEFGDGAYALTATLKAAVETAFVNLEKLAVRA